jgi:hypothetical protein
MRKMIMGVLAVAVIVGGVGGQTYWKKMYRGEADCDEAKAITPTPDGNFIVAGLTHLPGILGESVYLLKIKPNCDTVWTKTYGGSGGGDNYACAIVPIADGNFIVAGREGPGNIYLLKINPDGDTLWTRTYDNTNPTSKIGITPTSDGNFIVAGNIMNVGAMRSDVYLLKIKSDGNTLWAKTYSGTYNCSANAITPTVDGNFIIAGNNDFGVCLLKINPVGDTLWTKLNGETNAYIANAITPTADGNFIIAGATFFFSLDKRERDIDLFKINPDGDILWTKTYGSVGDDIGEAITPTTDGNFIVAGHTFSAGNYNAYLLKIKPDGDTLWTKMFDSFSFGIPSAITQTFDKNFIVTGSMNNNLYLFYFIDYRYAYKNSPFTFKIPVMGDSLNYGYTPLKAPADMTVSFGGAISWIPKTDSVYMEHVEYLITDDLGKTKDTITFNIFVNSKDHPITVANLVSRTASQSLNDLTIRQVSSKEVRFSLPSGTKSLGIYNIHGQLLENISVRGNQAAWLPKHAAGRYFAKAIWEKREAVKGFTVLK